MFIIAGMFIIPVDCPPALAAEYAPWKHAELAEISYKVPHVASIVKIPPPTQPPASAATFADLPCSQEEVQKINKLISTMAEHGKLTLLVKYQGELRQIGREIEHVHPMKFLSVILSDPYLKSCLSRIKDDYFKWSNFMDGIGNGLSVQDKQGKVSIYLNDFAKACNIPVESIQGFVQSHSWEDMIVYMINH